MQEKLRLLLLCLLLLVISPALVFSYARETKRDWDVCQHDTFGDVMRSGFNASWQALLFHNHLLMRINQIYGFSWAFPTFETIRYNVTTNWYWETGGGFLNNQFNHPYQGSQYFTAGRINGFCYFSSLFFAALGSYTWETMYATLRPSINDFITTAIGGPLVLGEILFRLYVEAYAAGVPLPLLLLINPLAGLTQFVTGWTPPDTGRHLYRLQFYFGSSFSRINYTVQGNQQELFSFTGGTVNIGTRIIYGNPFFQETWVPFRHFEMAVSAGVNPLNPNEYVFLRFNGEGYVFAFSPIQTGTTAMSTGLAIHMDYFQMGEFEGAGSPNYSTINLSSHALGWTTKYRNLFPRGTALDLRLHGGFTFFGITSFFCPEAERKFQNYNYGISTRIVFGLERERRFRFDVNMYHFFFWTYPGTTALSRGFVFAQFIDISYQHFVSANISLGLTYSLSMEHGTFRGFPNTRKRDNTVKLFVAWNM